LQSVDSHLVEVDDGLPELVLRLVEVAHTDFTEVTRVVLVHVGTVVVLTTGETTTTGMLPVLADTTVTGRDVAAAVDEDVSGMSAQDMRFACRLLQPRLGTWRLQFGRWRGTYCLRVLVALVGIVTVLTLAMRCSLSKFEEFPNRYVTFRQARI